MSIVTIKDGSGDEIQIEADRRGGLDITVQDDVDGSNYRMACFNRPEALQVAAAIYSALGEFVPVQKAPDFYVVRNVETDPKSDSLSYRRNTGIGSPRTGVSNNTFDTLDAAKEAALKWSAEFRRSYRVYAVTEVGTAGPTTPPVAWTEK